MSELKWKATSDIHVMKTITLWRPTGQKELDFVAAKEFKAWPPRLPEQPIFYPVLNRDYATKIARDWNAKHSGVGYVTRFEVDAEYLSQYDVQQVGGETILEYWIPAKNLQEFNKHIVGEIEVVETFRYNEVDDTIVSVLNEDLA